jgi:hypothetical protein
MMMNHMLLRLTMALAAVGGLTAAVYSTSVMANVSSCLPVAVVYIPINMFIDPAMVVVVMVLIYPQFVLWS